MKDMGKVLHRDLLYNENVKKIVNFTKHCLDTGISIDTIKNSYI